MRIWLLLACAAVVLSACAPVIVGGAGVVIADQVMEDRNGGDGLF